MIDRLKKIFSNRTVRIIVAVCAALLLLLAVRQVFSGSDGNASAERYTPNEQEVRLAALLSAIEDAGDVTVMIAEEGGVPVGAVVVFSGEDGILVRLRLTQAAAAALNIAENRITVYPSEK